MKSITLASPAGRRRYLDKRVWRGCRERSAVNTQLRCAVEGCGWNRRGLGRYCNEHRQRLESTGHPSVSRSVSRAEWSPLVETAARFVAEQIAAGHPSVTTAVAWADRELQQLADHGAGGHEVDYAARLGRVVRRGLDGRELLSRLIAAHLADDRGETARPRFKSDGHLRHQGGRLLLHRALLGRMPWPRLRASDVPLPPLRFHRDPSGGLRLFAFTRLNGGLGVVAMLAAEEIRRRLNNSH